jgi:ferredoxin
MPYRPVVDEDFCLAHGDCAVVAPSVFQVDDVARVIGEGPPELILAAARACPAGAIKVIDEESGEVVSEAP